MAKVWIELESCLVRYAIDYGPDFERPHEVDDATLARWKSAQAEWDRTQAELRALEDGAGGQDYFARSWQIVKERESGATP